MDSIYSKNKERLLNGIHCHLYAKCLNENSIKYKHCGGKGLYLYPEWEDFDPFMKWALANGYDEHLCLTRKNKKQGYNPDNCFWAPRKTKQEKSIPTRHTSAYQKECVSKSNSKPIVCVETGEVFRSVNEAAKAKNTNRVGISNCLRENQHSAAGFTWKYL
jgi:hypothetical protein